MHQPVENTSEQGSDAQKNDLNRREFIQRSTVATGAALVALTGCSDSINTAGHSMPTTEHQGDSEVARLIEQYWNAQTPTYEQIAAMGMQGYYESLPDRHQAFFTPEQIEAGRGKCECCSDEGNRQYSLDGEHDMLLVRTPGSGILQALDTTDQNPFDPDFIDATAHEALAAKVTVFTSHAGCGAFKAVYNNWLQKNGKEEASSANLDKCAKEWADAVAKRMKELAPDQSENISSDFIAKLDRPQQIHVARDLYLTDLDEFNAAYEGLPQGFVERTGGADDLHDVLEHVEVLRSIAFDPDHGFGTKFSPKPEEQFVICCIASTPERLEKLKKDAQKKVSSLKPTIAAMIRVDGFLQATV